MFKILYLVKEQYEVNRVKFLVCIVDIEKKCILDKKNGVAWYMTFPNIKKVSHAKVLYNHSEALQWMLYFRKILFLGIFCFFLSGDNC